MNSLIRILYIGLINIILFIFFEHYIKLLIILGFVILTLIVKQIFIIKKLSLQILLFDMGFFLSFLILYGGENIYINSILFIAIAFFIMKVPYSFYFRYSLHIDVLVLVLLFYKLINYYEESWSMFPIFLLFSVPYAYLSMQNFLFYVLRIVLILPVYYFFLNPSTFYSLIELYGVYMLLFAFPFQMIKLKNKELLMKILFIIFEFISIALVYYFNKNVTIDFIYVALISFMFYKTSFEILKNRLLNS